MDETQQLSVVALEHVVQLSSLAMVAAFFALLAHAEPAPELRWWARAWAANLLALPPRDLLAVQSDAAFPSSRGVYRRQDGFTACWRKARGR
jgi:hypothetical protein